MSLQYIGNAKAAFGYDAATGERGFLIKMKNKTGAATVKGTVVSADSANDNAFVAQSNEFDAFGVVQEAGVADTSDAWIWVNGSVAQVLFKDSTAAVRAYIALAADTDGRATNVEVPSSNPIVAEHFKEIGHVLESKDGGTDVLVLCHLHFN